MSGVSSEVKRQQTIFPLHDHTKADGYLIAISHRYLYSINQTIKCMKKNKQNKTTNIHHQQPRENLDFFPKIELED